MFRLFTTVGVKYIGSVKSIGNSVVSEGYRVGALSITPIASDGTFTVNRIFDKVTMQLPLPLPSNK